MASVLQVLFSIPEFNQRYQAPGQAHIQTCRDNPAECFYCQMAKMADGMLSGKYSKNTVNEQGEERGQTGIAPMMFKGVIGKGHPEFSTMRQQVSTKLILRTLKSF